MYPREPYEGAEYLVEGKKTLAGIPSFGFYVKDWRTVPLYRARSVGAFPIDNAQWDPGEVETPVRQFGVPSGAARRQVLGRTTAAGVHRRHAQRRDPRWPVQRSAIGGDALEVPDRAQERHRAPLSAGGEPDRRPAAESFRDLDVHECRGCRRRRVGTGRVRRHLEPVRQRHRRDDGCSASRRRQTRASRRPRICRPVRALTSGSRFPRLVVRRAGRSQHMPISGETQMAGRLSVSSACPAAIRQEARREAAQVTAGVITGGRYGIGQLRFS